MNPVKHPNETRSIGAPRNWVPARDGDCGALSVADVIEGQHPVMESLWRPEPAELAALAQGGAVILRIHGGLHPVVSVGVTAEAHRG